MFEDVCCNWFKVRYLPDTFAYFRTGCIPGGGKRQPRFTFCGGQRFTERDIQMHGPGGRPDGLVVRLIDELPKIAGQL